MRTVFLLEYISNLPLRERIRASTNKAEAYNGFSKWLFVGGDGIIAENDPEEQEKRIKYNGLLAGALVMWNVGDMTNGLQALAREGYQATREQVATFSPYLTRPVKRFGDYVIDLGNIPQPLDGRMPDLG